MAVVALRAYKAQLTARIEMARIEASGGVPDETQEQIRDLEERVRGLTDRLDFTERLLEKGAAAPSEQEAGSALE